MNRAARGCKVHYWTNEAHEVLKSAETTSSPTPAKAQWKELK